MHRILLVIAYGLKGVSEGAFEHTVLPYISPSHSSMEWGLLRARTSFTENPSRNVYPQNNANARTSTYPSRCTLHNNHNMNKSSSSPRHVGCDSCCRPAAMQARYWSDDRPAYFVYFSFVPFICMLHVARPTLAMYIGRSLPHLSPAPRVS